MNKTCKKCGVERPATNEFFHNGSGRYNLKNDCKSCRSKQNHNYEGRSDSYDLFILNGYLAKRCRSCNEIIPLRCYNRKTRAGLFGRESKCKACVKSVRDYALEYKRYYTDKSIKKDPQYSKKYKRNSYLKYQNNPEFRLIANEKVKIASKKYRDNLNTSYVINQLKKRQIIDPSNEIIEQKRLSLKIKRVINEKQRAINSQGNNGCTNNVLS